MPNLLDYYNDAFQWRTRGEISKIKDVEPRDFDEVDVVNAIGLFDQTNDLGLVKEAYKKRGGYGIRKRKDSNSITADAGSSLMETYERSTVHTAVDMGFYETLVTGIGSRIHKAISTLTTQRDASMEYIDTDKGDEENGGYVASDDAGELIGLVRKRGVFDRAFESLDFAASAVEVAYLHQYAKGRDIAYDVVLPTDIYFAYADHVISYDSMGYEEKRYPDKTDLDDAAAVIIRLETTAEYEDNVYLAYVGGCADVQDGRMVTYHAREPWPIPALDDENIISEYSYLDDGRPSNPLTYRLNYGQDEEKRIITTEYPIIPWRGGYRTISKSITPVSTSLYETCLELELAWSRVLKYALKNMQGTNVIGYDIGAPGGTSLPRNLEIPVLQPGQKFEQLFGGSGEGQTALSIMNAITKQVAGGRNVPGYMVIHGDTMPESGYSLAIQSQPLVDFRDRRVSINTPYCSKIFDVEKALLACYWADAATSVIPRSIEQVWNPGTWSPPKDEGMRISEITSARDAEFIDHTESVRRYHGDKSDADADARIEKYIKRDEDYGKKPEPGSEETGFKF